MKQAIQQQQRQGIDPSAMFYTELEVMDTVLGRMDAVRVQDPYALWIPSRSRTGSRRPPAAITVPDPWSAP